MFVYCFRFFVSSAEIQRHESTTQIKEEKSSVKNNVAEKKSNSNSPTSKSRDKEEILKMKQSPSTPKPSPGSAFTWSKFKFSKLNNVATNSDKANKNYKRVVSDSCLSNYFSTQSREKNFEKPSESLPSAPPVQRVMSCEEMDSAPDSLSQASSVSYSQSSGAYSIDLDCLPDSQEVQIISEEFAAQDSSKSQPSNPTLTLQVRVLHYNAMENTDFNFEI